jgi:hypothetical protein
MILGASRGPRILQRRPDNDDHAPLKPFSLEAQCRCALCGHVRDCLTQAFQFYRTFSYSL